ncbi:MAG: hypothetical protein PHD92_09175 [Eubacteriales bacterium]|nr:hypothetical protein [Eubacteriales bacterium]
MSNLHGGKTLNDIIEQQKIEDRKQYQYRQELRRQQEERAASAMKAAEKTLYGKILDKQEEVKQLVNNIQIGSPRNEEYISAALKRICDVLDYCLNECKPEISPGDKRTEE